MSRATAARQVAAACLALGLLATSIPASFGAGPDEDRKGSDSRPSAVLADAEAAFDPSPGARRVRSLPADTTSALTRLFTVTRGLSRDERVRARELLARPTDTRDPYGDSYLTGAIQKLCTAALCVHYPTLGPDAPPSLAWVKKTLQVLGAAHRFHTEELGFRTPVGDPGGRSQGGDSRFDVYLKNIGARGIYGYCAPEYRLSGYRHVGSGFCVFDNDFAEFRGPRGNNLRVTAAHEYFHAVQFGYDFAEDPWLAEATAAWAEERFADNANGNRQYLPRSQLREPNRSLDLFERGGTYHYGQWVFFEHLTQRFSRSIVRQIYTAAAETRRGGDRHSLQALTRVLKNKGGLTNAFSSYAAANLIPGATYEEGAAWPAAKVAASAELGKKPSNRSFSGRYPINHLSSHSVRLRPGSGLGGTGWKLKISVNAPDRAQGSGAVVTVVKRGKARQVPVRLTKGGYGTATVGFAKRSAASVFVTLANASTRTRCGAGTDFACNGAPRDQQSPFSVRAIVTK